MLTNPPPPPVVVRPRKGLGCWLGGCVGLLIALLVIVGLVAAIGYFSYDKVLHLTSATPTTVPNPDGGDEVYQAAVQKLNAFSQALQQNQPATLQLNASEINTLIARDPQISASGLRAFFTLDNDRAQIRLSAPSSMLPGIGGVLKDRYINGLIEVTPVFDPATKNVNFIFNRLTLGGTAIPSQNLTVLQNEANPILNNQLQSTEAKRVLDRTKSIEIHDGELTIHAE